jgi:hypothetical protein
MQAGIQAMSAHIKTPESHPSIKSFEGKLPENDVKRSYLLWDLVQVINFLFIRN